MIAFATVRPFLPYIAGAAIVIAAGFGIKWYGSSQYKAGYSQAETDQLLNVQAATQIAQQEKDRAEANYRGAVAAREAIERDADARVARLNGLLSKRSSNAQSASGPSGANGTGAAWDLVLAECVREYREMGKHAGRLADKVNGWQAYGAVLSRWGAATSK